jgi:hypothetical protein
MLQVGLMTTEAGGQATFTVALTAQPSADVTIPMASSDLTEGTVSPATLTFTTANWSMPQTVTVTGVDDNLADGNIPFFVQIAPAVSADLRYNGLDAPDISVTNIDNETPQVYVKTRHILKTSEAGLQASFRMRLTIRPTANVTCPIASSDTTEGVVAPVSVTFTPQNFATQQFVRVTGVDDTVKDGDVLYTILTGPCTSTDPAYNGIDPTDPLAINRDND